VRRLLGADVAVSVTGVGGPDSSEGEPPGTVYVAVTGAGDTVVRRLDIDGADPERILAETARHALELLVDTLERVEAGR
jgi:nicotinamide-nucleotide amidase